MSSLHPGRDRPATLLAMLCALLVAITASAAPARAQLSGAGPRIIAELVAENSAQRAGSTADIAIAMTPTSDGGKPWHGYWKNGGDAGFGMQVTWSLPAGVTIGELSYPTPDTLIVGGLMNHVYERPYALIAPITIAPGIAPGTRLTIRGDARWLACTDEVCVPEQRMLETTVTVGAQPSSADARFAAWRAALPPMIAEPARFTAVDGQLRLAVPLAASVTPSAPHLFLEQPRLNQPGGAQRFTRSGDWLVVDMPAGADLAAAQRIAGLLRLETGRGLRFTAERRADVPAPGALVAEIPAARDGGAAPAATQTGGAFDGALFVSALVGAIIGGLILNIMPCVFPILSLKALALARAGGDEKTVRAEGVAYTLGAVFTCLALGAILLLLRASGEALGWAFQLQRPESVVLLIILMGAITANLAGLFEFGTLGFASRIGGGESGTKSAFATGALAAFIATPCTGPFLGAALGATLALPAWAALPIFGGLGLGLALPFLALALFPALRARLPKPGPWMVTLRRWLAVPMALTALALVWLLGRQVGIDGWMIGAGALVATLALGWWAGRAQRQGGNASIALFGMAALIVPISLLLPTQTAAVAAADDSVIGAQPWSDSALAAARARGPVFVYFTADWCVTCKVNEAAAINRADTAAAFERANVTALVADWTNADAAITAELARHGRNSVPLYLWYPSGGGAPEILPQLLTPAMLAERAAAP